MFPFVTRAAFVAGLLIGVFLAVLLKPDKLPTKPSEVISTPFFELNYKKWFREAKLTRHRISFDSLRYANSTKYTLESNFLQSRVNVLCLVLVKKGNNARAVEQTWGKHCNNLKFINITSEPPKLINRTKQESSWTRLCNALKSVPEQHHWVLVVHDYTFVLVENLRLFLAGLNPEHKYYLGHAEQFWGTVYNKGQAGYVISRGSIEAFKHTSCAKSLTYNNKEDYYLGQHLRILNITPSDTRDRYGLSTFHPYNLYRLIYNQESDPNKLEGVYPGKCCSSNLVSFQAIEGDKMHTYYYLLYTLQIFRSGEFGNRPAVKESGDDFVWKSFLRAKNLSENVSSEQYYKIWEDIVDAPDSFAKHMKREEFPNSVR